MNSLHVDLSQIANRVRATRRGNHAGLIAQDGKSTVWAEKRLNGLIDAIDRGDRGFRGGMLDAIFVQYATFYLLGLGKLSKSINYDCALEPSDFKCRPDTVSFITTKLCNYRCPHCYNASGLPSSKRADAERKSNDS